MDETSSAEKLPEPRKKGNPPISGNGNFCVADPRASLRRRPLIQKKDRPESQAGLSRKIWRQPTLAEAIQPLPLARLCLTAEFGMGSGRTTALWSPKNC